MEKQRLDELIDKYILRTATNAEQQELLDWYHAENEKEVIWVSEVSNQESAVKQRMLSNIQSATLSKAVSRTSYWPRIAVAASVVIALSAGLWFYMFRQAREGVKSAPENYANDIAPGKNTATLKLASGKIISLSDAKSGVVIDAANLTYDDGTHIQTANSRASGGAKVAVSDMYVSTPRGGQYQVRLPDGTKVWLNAASSLKFPSSFAGLSHRKVELVGEAYFEVNKDSKHPFIVTTARQQLEVIGTHFNINSYADEEETRTTLLEGAVRIAGLSATSGKSIVLKPGQEAILKSNFDFRIQEVFDLEQAVAWKNGNFVFSNQDIVTIMRQIARWYDAEIIYQQKPSNVLMGGVMSRSKNVSEILQLLEATGVGHFKIEGKNIIVTH